MGKVTIGGVLDRRNVVSKLLENRKDLLVVCGLGSSCYDVMAVGDHDNNYYLWGAMGSAAMVGFGLAQAKPDYSVLVITGDGEVLMGLGAFATIGLKKPKNLSIAILDNGHFGETGMQLSHAGQGLRLNEVAKACNFDYTAQIDTLSGVESFKTKLNTGLNCATILIKPENLPRVLPPRDGVYIKNRFRAALGFHAT
jgi:thiamine pyrophosphate-dependent acetolactate synthase large subunit-like protein